MDERGYRISCLDKAVQLAIMEKSASDKDTILANAEAFANFVLNREVKK